jgi:hypothetical protein
MMQVNCQVPSANVEELGFQTIYTSDYKLDSQLLPDGDLVLVERDTLLDMQCFGLRRGIVPIGE